MAVVIDGHEHHVFGAPRWSRLAEKTSRSSVFQAVKDRPRATVRLGAFSPTDGLQRPMGLERSRGTKDNHDVALSTLPYSQVPSLWVRTG